jgi:exosome complex component RRP42
LTKSNEIVTNIRQKQISEQLIQNKRIDGRTLGDFREIKTEIGLIKKASGSALVHLGKTKVLTGVKVETGQPYSDKPDEGVLTVNVELVPLASPSFEAGPPREEAVELARVVDRGIRESKAVDLKKLCIIPGKLVFVVFVDIYVLDHDGNLVDASALASILALIHTMIKDYTLSDDEQLEFKKKETKLPIQNVPVEITIVKIGDKLMVDPTLEEERMIEAKITFALGNDDEICAIQKSGAGSLTLNEVDKALSIAKDKSKEIREHVLGELTSG